ncbi:Ribonuclease J 1 [[Clostridium] cellulosi]|uniref:Ribonuclease J n=1 Tax=[Clostridium] cellulosi TaxID=29343 RepID=A0A078KRP4_9FIRM|nr:Ribonuclease J 1 [[Clostridium] cellulosi]
MVKNSSAAMPAKTAILASAKTVKTTVRTRATQRRTTRTRKQAEKPAIPVHIIPLGGLDEIGKNMTVFECGNDIFVVDCGLAFPDDDMLGIDLVIPDVTWLEKNSDRVRGIVLTHGHEDHIGGLPYVLRNINMPVYGSRLTLGILEGKLKEHGLLGKVELNVVEPGDKVQFGCMEVEFINVTHSIAGSLAIAIKTPSGVIVQTGDFKIDCTPILGDMIDLARFGELGKNGVLALLMDSTNAERPGYTMSERKVGESFDALFQRAQNKRIIIATFASNVHRVQQIVNAAACYGRHVAISGRSMVNVINIAIELGYLDVPEGLIVDLDLINRYPPEKMVIVTTGSQGEAMSALYRMAFSDHNKIEVGPNDFIIISANPIPGNEKTVSKMVNELLKLGAEVVYESLAEVHASGHACQEELKIMLGLTRPKFFIPVHGEQKHLRKNMNLALSMGMDKRNILITEIGQVIELTPNSCKVIGTVPSGRVLVDGFGVGDVGSIVLRDRKHLAQDGLIVVVATIDSVAGTVVSGPDIVSRGFVYVRESESLMDETRRVAKDVLEECAENGIKEWGTIKSHVKDALSKLLYERTKRSPMILPVIMEI